MGVMNRSPRVSVCRSGRQQGGQRSCQRHARKDLQSWVGSGADEVLSPAGQSLWWPMPREISMAWSSTLVRRAWLSRQWSGASFSYTLKLEYSTLLGLFDKCLGTPMPSREFAQEPISGWSRSTDPAALTTCAGILSGSPCQRCLLCARGQICLLAGCVFSDLGHFPLEPK